jgi:hypothetical protein
MRAIRWEAAARVVVEGLPEDEARRAAARWCGKLGGAGVTAGARGPLRLVALQLAIGTADAAPRRVRIGMRAGDDGGPLELRVGPHAVRAGTGDEPDVIRCSRRRAPSQLELELLVDLGINHLLARQGLATLHGCAFTVGGVSVLGLGESFSGKTTAAVAAMRAGGQVVSDDSVLAVPGDGRSVALLPVRSYGWLRGRTREIVPRELVERMVAGDEGGVPRWVLSREDGGEGFVDRSAPNLVWVLSVDRRRWSSSVEPIDHGQVFAALIRASSPLFLSRHCPEIRDRLVPVFRDLCAQCRGYRVRLGRRLLEDPAGEMAWLVEASSRNDE